MYKKIIFILLIIFLSISFVSANPLVFAHFVTWYSTNAGIWNNWIDQFDSGQYYNATADPVTGIRNISAIDYPIIGPYDSRDPNVIEYQILLNQSAGISGFICDYYGTNATLPSLVLTKQGFDTLFTHINYLNKLNTFGKYSNFKISIAYDENALKAYSSTINSPLNIQAANNDLTYVKNNYTVQNYYYQKNGKPLLLIWNNFVYLSNSGWSNALLPLTNSYTINFRDFGPDNNLIDKSYFPWVYDYSWTNGYPYNSSLWGQVYLSGFYNKMATNSQIQFRTGGVWAGFNESKAPWIPPYPTATSPRIMSRQNGSVFNNTWSLTLSSGTSIIQLITWNDWNEGTEIEPSIQYGYSYIANTYQEITGAGSNPISPTNELAILAPQYIYNARLAVNQGIVSNTAGFNTTMITNAIKAFYNKGNYSSLSNSTIAMGTKIPTIISFKKGNNAIWLEWNKIPNSAGYKVYLGTQNDYLNLLFNSNIQIISNPNSTNAVFTNLLNPAGCYCTVSAYVGSKNNESRYKIEGWISPIVGNAPSSILAPIKNFQVQNINNSLQLSWSNPSDPNYYSTFICYLSSSKYPQTPSEGFELVNYTNSTTFTFSSTTAGYKYFSAFAMDRVGNFSAPVFANIYTVDHDVKLANNLIEPSKGNNQAIIYIDTIQSGQKINITIYNTLGKIIKSYGQIILNSGRNTFYWPVNTSDLSNIPSGVYIVSITGDITQKEKIVVIK